MKKLTKKQIKKYFKELTILEDDFYFKLFELEKEIAKETGIDDLEFFWSDNEIVGIGNTSRTMKLINRI